MGFPLFARLNVTANDAFFGTFGAFGDHVTVTVARSA
jgi:hypothetical protein